jgi:MFS family permease
VREIDSGYAWFRLAVSMTLSALGGVGMWSVVVALPAMQADFAVARGEASLPFTLTTIGFGLGGVVMGKASDRFGIVWPVVIGACCLGLGYILVSLAPGIGSAAVAYGVLIGMMGTGATFSPLMADISKWFERRRGIAVALCAAGNYIAGTLWPPIVELLIRRQGWRTAHLVIGIVCIVCMVPLALLLRSPAPVQSTRGGLGARRFPAARLSPGLLQTLLVIAGVGCCVAMSMPQVHIVAYCGDLGYGVANGARMLSLMLGFGIVSRIASGFIADRIGGMKTLVIGSALQSVALALYLTSDQLVPLFVISAMFGLFQGGLVPSYAIVIRENYPVEQTGTRVGIVMMATLFGMAFGGWISGVIYDRTGSYHAAFANGMLWNLLNLGIVLFVLRSARGRDTRTLQTGASAT